MIGENITFSPELCNIAIGSFVGQITYMSILFKVMFYGLGFYVAKRAFDVIILKIKDGRQ